MEAIAFPQANKVLGAPRGREEDVDALPIFNYNGQCISCWKLSEEELAEVARTGVVFVNILSGDTQPPVFVGTSLSSDHASRAHQSGAKLRRDETRGTVP